MMAGMIKSISGTSVAPSNGAATQDVSGFWQKVMSERVAEAMQPGGQVDDPTPEGGLDAGQDDEDSDQ